MSKYRRDETAPIVKHKHCAVCGTPVDMGKEFCTDKCRIQNRKVARSKTRTFILITAAIVIFYVLFIIVNFKL